MVTIRRTAVDTDIERKIVIGLITDDRYCAQVQRMLRKEYFKIDYAIGKPIRNPPANKSKTYSKQRR
jgi:hypothetical protein